jgi:hypothetical protein
MTGAEKCSGLQNNQSLCYMALRIFVVLRRDSILSTIMLRGVAIIPGQFWAFSVPIAVLPGNIVCVSLLGRYVIQGVSSFGRSITGLFIVSSLLPLRNYQANQRHILLTKKEYRRSTTDERQGELTVCPAPTPHPHIADSTEIRLHCPPAVIDSVAKRIRSRNVVFATNTRAFLSGR